MAKRRHARKVSDTVDPDKKPHPPIKKITIPKQYPKPKPGIPKKKQAKD